jgi:NADH/NAD ratio-sensing transcriptional regulator Rex
MKKIKLTVATLLLSGMCYGQTQVKNDAITKKIAYVESVNTIQDIIEWMHYDVESGQVGKEVGEIYIKNLYSLLSRLEDINAGYIDCENCDEID